MELFSIENEQGYLVLPEKKVPIEQVTTDDIFTALHLIMEDEGVLIGSEDEAALIKNPAGNIIYSQLWKSFKEALDSREAILLDVNSAFEDAEKKYL